MLRSISLDWIITHIEEIYDIEKKGEHFLNLYMITFDKTSGETFNQFYKRLRNHFEDNLRKKNDVIGWNYDEVLAEDEKLEPTLECTIVYLALKEIDSRLPAYVQQVYGHQMVENTTVRDLQPRIFQALPRLLTELDSKDSSLNASNSYGREQKDVDFGAFGFRGRGQGGRGDSRGRGQPRGRWNGQNRDVDQRGAKFCGLCQVAKAPRFVYTSHNKSECKRWPSTAVQAMEVMMQETSLTNEEENDTVSEVKEETGEYEDGHTHFGAIGNTNVYTPASYDYSA